jgi:hypothetical protein
MAFLGGLKTRRELTKEGGGNGIEAKTQVKENGAYNWTREEKTIRDRTFGFGRKRRRLKSAGALRGVT